MRNYYTVITVTVYFDYSRAIIRIKQKYTSNYIFRPAMAFLHTRSSIVVLVGFGYTTYVWEITACDLFPLSISIYICGSSILFGPGYVGNNNAAAARALGWIFLTEATMALGRRKD